MAPLRSKEMSQEMYHRVYRLIKRNVNPHTIAATLNLPLRTILGVINRVERGDPIDSSSENQNHSGQENENQEFLDIYFYPKTRYAILDLVGVLSNTSIDKLRAELEKAQVSSWKAVAIRMSDVTAISETAAKVLLESKERFTMLGRYLGILDPAAKIEPSLVEFGIEPAVPVFGTESAFEDAAFTKRGKAFTRRGGSQGT